MGGIHTSYIDEKGKVWTNIGNGISFTNFDGSPIEEVPEYLKDIIIETLTGENFDNNSR